MSSGQACRDVSRPAGAVTTRTTPARIAERKPDARVRHARTWTSATLIQPTDTSGLGCFRAADLSHPVGSTGPEDDALVGFHCVRRAGSVEHDGAALRPEHLDVVVSMGVGHHRGQAPAARDPEGLVHDGGCSDRGLS